MQLSIIIVNYKNPHLILQCVKSIVEREKAIDYEIIVVDNDSQDDTERQLRAICPNLKWIQMGYNSGFGRANNAGVKVARGEYILFLNSDIIVPDDNVLCNCVKRLKGLNDSGIVLGTKLSNVDGSYQETLRLRYPSLKDKLRANALYILIVNRLLNRHPYDEEKHQQYEAQQKSGFVAWMNGAFLLVNKQVVQTRQLLFDDDLFLYGEDIEWCWMARKKGVRFYHYADSRLIHIGSASMPGDELKRAQIIVSDWVMARKCRGRFVLFASLMLESFNLILDSVLYRIAKLRKTSLDGAVLKEAEFRTKYYYLIRRYGLMILLGKKLSSAKTFKTNCYEDVYLKEA